MDSDDDDDDVSASNFHLQEHSNSNSYRYGILNVKLFKKMMSYIIFLKIVHVKLVAYKTFNLDLFH